MSAHARVGWRGVPLALLLLSATARAQVPALGVPVLDSSGVVRWTPAPIPMPAWARGLVVPPATRTDSLVLWRAATEEPHLRAVALHRLALLQLAAGDTVQADSCWRLAAAARSPWTWPALRGRAEIALANARPGGADSLLEQADRAGWSDPERAAWLALRVRTRAAVGDTTQAIQFARQALKVYPSAPATLQSLARLEELLYARHDSLTAADESDAAEVEVAHGRASAAIARLRQVVEDPNSGFARWNAGLRLCEVLRGARRFSEARATVRAMQADRRVEVEGSQDRLAIESVRIERDARRPDSALVLYARFGRDHEAAAGVGWEAGRTAEDAGRWGVALTWYRSAGGRRAMDAVFRAGLMYYVLGHADSAAALWASDSSDAARFWLGVARRALGDGAAGDSALRLVARLPGYSFYRAVARETLGTRGWPASPTQAPDAAGDSCAAIRAADELAGVGASDEAAVLLSRMGTRGVLVTGDEHGCDPVEEALAGARVAYAIGRPGLGIALADRATRLDDPELRNAERWSRIPWAYPPGLDPLPGGSPDSVVSSPEPALLFAVAYQESRFDPRARSRSDALGLMQLKLATAREVARWLGDPVPDEGTLFDPATSVRYGARYLARLLRRFDGSVAVALSAYNAGPGTVPSRWRELLARGGEALFCELASNPMAQDYAKKILGFRQAYRELRPTARP